MGFSRVLLGCLLLLGCVKQEFSNDRVSPERPLWFHRPIGAMQVLFRKPLPMPSRAVGEEYERGRAEIDPEGRRVFVGSSDHGLYALRAHDGSVLWRFETGGFVQCEPLYDRELDVVYFGSHDGALYAVSARDGSLRFRYNTGAEVSRKPVLSGETLVFANAADHLFAADRRTGSPKWHAHRTPALGMEIAGYAGPSVHGSVVFMAYSDGNVAAYDVKDGTERFPSVDLAGEAEQSAGEVPRYLDVDTTPVIDDLPTGPVVYVASFAGGVFALDGDRGTILWKNERALGTTDLLLWREPARLDPDTSVRIPERKRLIASSAETGLWALDPLNNGAMLWRIPLPEGGITAPAPVAGALLVGTSQYGLFLLSPLNGKVIDSLDVGSGFGHTPTAFGRRAYAMSNGGTLLGIHVEPPEPARAILF